MAQNQHTTEYMLGIKTTLQETQEFIEQPVKRLKEIVRMQEAVKVPQDPPTLHSAGTVLVSSNFKDDVKQYRELLVEREKAKQSMNKVLTELVQHLRSTLPQKENPPAKESEELATQRKIKNETFVDRRIR